MSAPSPVISMQTPQREFAGAKLLIFFDIHKKICTFDADFLIYRNFLIQLWAQAWDLPGNVYRAFCLAPDKNL